MQKRLVMERAHFWLFGNKERERRIRRLLAEYADGLGMWRRRQLHWLRHNSRPILYLFLYFKFTSGHCVIARASGVIDTCSACFCVVCEESASSAFKIKTVCIRNPQLIAPGKIRDYCSFSDSGSLTSSSTSSESSKSSSNSSSNSSSYSSSGSSLGGRTSLSI